MSASKPRLAKVIPFRSEQMRETARGFRLLADAAERGEIIGAGYTVIDMHGRTRVGVFGAAASNLAAVYLGAHRLAYRLLRMHE